MYQDQIKTELQDRHQAFINFINGLNEDTFNFKFQEKWTAGQQLAHIVMCIKPLVAVFGLDKLLIEQKFGKLDREGLSYDQLLTYYLEKFTAGGKAPANYVPDVILFERRESLCQNLTELIVDLCLKMDNYSEADLDRYCIPHPLLGMLSLREMLYNAIYHVEHHHKAAIQNLQYR
ncbi:MAG: DinB family protein [Saprospiraceae bacterium]|nr:DinB family protein [Saprospiraceae bacterium]MBK7738260.1 DinB family protein [Saprospiraceae bacterium]MBK7913166.1 DinB family protein [Saprospiraceae bacterium]